MLRRARWCGLAILLGIFGGRRGPAPARADDEPEAAAPATEDPLLWQWFDVGAITAGRTQFGGPRGPFPPRPGDVDDAANPLSSGPGEETVRPFGSITDVVDLINQEVRSADWEREGVRMAEEGTESLRILASKRTLARVQRFLRGLERDATRTVTLDAIVVRGDPGAERGPDGLAGAFARGLLEPLVGARAVGMQDQIVAARTGGEQAHLADQDVEVAVGAQATEPIVGVLLDGLVVRAQLASMTDARARGNLQAWWAASARLSGQRTANGDLVERPEVDGRAWKLVFDVVPGVWTLLPSTGGLSLAIRLTVATFDSPFNGPTPLAPLPRPRVLGPLEARRWDLRDLGQRVPNFRGSSLLRLDPSNFAPPAPPELPEPDSPYPGDQLMDVLQWMVGEEALQREGASLHLEYGTLWASLDRDSAAGVDRCLAEIRKRFLGTTRLRGTVISLPLVSFPEYLTGLDDGATLLADGGSALMRRPGVRVVDRCALRLEPGQRGAVVGGRQHSYVADYDVEIAEKSHIGNPIVRAWLEGLSLDVVAHRCLAGDTLWCEMRLQRSTARATRAVPTPYGPIDCPSIGVHSASGAFALTVGGSRIVAAHLEGGVVTLVILGAAAE